MIFRRLKIWQNLILYGIIVFILFFSINYIIKEQKKNKPIILGFSAQLTGRQAELGIQERNGAQLAIEKVNESGGIDGRMITLKIHDDLGIPQEAQDGDKQLIDAGSVAIIGHATTSQTLAGLEVTNPAKVVMMGPTVSTPELSGIDDYFFRVHPSFEKSCKELAKYIYEDRGITNIAMIYDKKNLSYSKAYCDIFSDEYKSLGGDITNIIEFSSDDKPEFSMILSNIYESNPQGLFIVASDIDTALLSQRVRLMNWKVSLFASPWAQTEALINNGGKSVEGLELEQSYDLDNKSEAFIDFKSRYNDRFGNDPSFGAAYSYESTLILVEALKNTHGSKDGLKEALLQIKDFQGLVGAISFDEFGDAVRDSYLSTIKNSEFVRVKKLYSADWWGE